MSIYTVAGFPYSDELYHFGILGQKWGIRRYQNKDGTLTSEGKVRYGRDVTRMSSKALKRQFAESEKAGRLSKYKKESDKVVNKVNNSKEMKEYNNINEGYTKFKNDLAAALGVSPNRIVFDDATNARIELARLDVWHKAKEIYEQNKDKIASSLLEDMDWDVTEQGIEYVKRVLLDK